MAVFTLSSVIAATGSDYIGLDEVVFTGISTDTRTTQPGDLFIALKGERFDGHDFLSLAAEKGAAGALVSQPISHPPDNFHLIPVHDTLEALADLARCYRMRFSIPVIAVTGSVGKTTTKEMIAHIVRGERTVLSAPENWNNEIGVPRTILDLHDYHTLCVLEFAMRGKGQIRELAECASPTIGVITNIGESHVELLGSIEAVADAKAELFESLPRDGVAIANRYDPFFERISKKAACRIVTFGMHQDSDFHATNSRADSHVTRFVLSHNNETREIELPLPGRHNVLNALAAIAACDSAGISIDSASRALPSFEAVPHRSRILQLSSGLTVLDDCYNSSPASIRAALQVLHDWNTRGRKFLVFGDMKELGTRSPEAHREVGVEAVAAGVNVILSVGQMASLAAVEAERLAPGSIETIQCEEACEALKALRERAVPGDFILVKASRAMKLERVVAGLE